MSTLSAGFVTDKNFAAIEAILSACHLPPPDASITSQVKGTLCILSQFNHVTAFSKIVYLKEVPVGFLMCDVTEVLSAKKGANPIPIKLTMRSIATLPQFRRNGVASVALRRLLDELMELSKYWMDDQRSLRADDRPGWAAYKIQKCATSYDVNLFELKKNLKHKKYSVIKEIEITPDCFTKEVEELVKKILQEDPHYILEGNVIVLKDNDMRQSKI